MGDEKHKNRTDIIFRLLRFVSSHRLKMLGLIMMSLIAAALEAARPFPIKLVIDYVLPGKDLPASFRSFFGNPDFLTERFQLLIVAIIAMAAISILAAALAFYSMSVTIKLAQQLVLELSVNLYSKLQQLSVSFYNSHKTGDLVQRLSGDVYVVYFLVAQILIPAVPSVVSLGLMFYIMSGIDRQMAWIALSAIPLMGLVLAIFAKPMSAGTTRQYKKLGDLSSFLQESLSSMKIIQAFAREPYMRSRIRYHSEDYSRSFQSATLIATGYNQIMAIVAGIITACLVGLGAYRGIQGNISAGDLFIFIGYVGGMIGPVSALFTGIGTAIAIRSRAKRVFDLLDSTETVPETSEPVPVQLPIQSIRFEHVSFTHAARAKKGNPTLSDINIELFPGQITAIVGATGAGKTSLISLLTRFFDPTDGRIVLNGMGIKNYRLADFREQISIVLQDPFLFPMSIRENIAFGNPHASEADIIEAAKFARAHEFIQKLPAGYDTMLSEAGANMSGGEKQRISLARSFVKKASIWILDEPTSALDAATEASIFKEIMSQSGDRIIILISHRLSTIRHADQIVTLQEGKVVEAGTHDLLLQNRSVYAELFKYHGLQ